MSTSATAIATVVETVAVMISAIVYFVLATVSDIVATTVATTHPTPVIQIQNTNRSALFLLLMIYRTSLKTYFHAVVLYSSYFFSLFIDVLLHRLVRIRCVS